MVKHHTPSNIKSCEFFALCMIGQLFAHHKYIPMLHKNNKIKKDNGIGWQGLSVYKKVQGLSLDRKHVCLRWGHVVSLGLQYAKMSSTDQKRLNYYHLNSKNTLQNTLNSKLGCGYSAGQWNTAFLHSLVFFPLPWGGETWHLPWWFFFFFFFSSKW